MKNYILYKILVCKNIILKKYIICEILTDKTVRKVEKKNRTLHHSTSTCHPKYLLP